MPFLTSLMRKGWHWRICLKRRMNSSQNSDMDFSWTAEAPAGCPQGTPVITPGQLRWSIFPSIQTNLQTLLPLLHHHPGIGTDTKGIQLQHLQLLPQAGAAKPCARVSQQGRAGMRQGQVEDNWQNIVWGRCCQDGKCEKGRLRSLGRAVPSQQEKGQGTFTQAELFHHSQKDPNPPSQLKHT